MNIILAGSIAYDYLMKFPGPWVVFGDGGIVSGGDRSTIASNLRPIKVVVAAGFYALPPDGKASAARHQPDRQPSRLMPNFGSWAGRLHAVLDDIVEILKPISVSDYCLSIKLLQSYSGNYCSDDIRLNLF